VGEVAAAAGRVVDPLTAAGKGVKAAGGLAAKGLGLTTGVGEDAIKTAAQAGATGGEAGAALRGGMTGAVTGEEVVKEARGAVDKLRQVRGDEYRKNMKAIGADDTVLDFDKVDTAVEKVAGVKTYKGQNISPGTAEIRQSVTKAVADWKALDPVEYHTAEGLDALKQKIGDIRDATQYGTPERVVADSVYHAIRNTIVDQAPEYGKAMKGYEEASKQIKEIEKTLSIPGGGKVNIDTALRKLQSVLRNNVNTNYGRRKELADVLVSSGAPHLLEKLSGMALSSATPRGLAGVLGGGELLASLATLIAGNPALAAKLAASVAATSPKLVGGAAYAAGAATRLPLRQLGQSAFQAGRLPQ